MKYIFSLLSLLFLQILSFKDIKPKICINCKYFKSDTTSSKFGKCSLFVKEESINYKLVNGENNDEYIYCFLSRQNENMCGKEGKMYKKNNTKKSI